MELDRRQLLALIGGSVAALGLSVAEASTGSKAFSLPAIDLLKEYGMSLPVIGPGEHFWKNPEHLEFLGDVLKISAKKHLPPGTRYEIRLSFPMNYGRRRDIAWYSRPTEMAKIEDWTDHLHYRGAPYDALRGFYLVGRQTIGRR